MGLPNQWDDPVHGLCLTKWAAVAHVKQAGRQCDVDGDVLVIRHDSDVERRVSPVEVAAIGLMYRVYDLDGG